MQELNGYIKLYRKLVRWEWYQDNVVKSLFLHCLISASFKDFSWMGQKLKAGQFITSRKHLAEELGFSEQQIRTAIKKLESTQEITSKSTNKFTIITVNNWSDYQGEEENTNQVSNFPITNNQPTNNQQITTYEECKEGKECKEVYNACAGAHANTPLLSEILSYISEHGLNVDGETFFKKYSENGWKTKRGKPITDWKRLLRTWDKKELKERPTYPGGYGGVKSLTED